jgi:hypothetical protein
MHLPSKGLFVSLSPILFTAYRHLQSLRIGAADLPSHLPAEMAFEATTILELVLSLTWTCRSPPANQKNTLFAQAITSHLILEELASAVSLVFAPGMFEALQAIVPPPIQYFKSLPTDTTKRWAIYLLVLEKSSCRLKVYIGSATESRDGVYNRFHHYDLETAMPMQRRKSS